METVTNAFNLFINTDRNIPSGSRGDDVMIPIHQSPIAAGDDEHIRLTLDQFSMRKSWYDINRNNNKFSFKPPWNGGVKTEILLDEGDWVGNEKGFVDMLGVKTLAAINQAYDVAGEIENAAYDDVTETFVLNFQFDAAEMDSLFGDAQAVEQGGPIFQCLIADGDAYKVLGGSRIGAEDSDQHSFTGIVDRGTNTFGFTSKFKIDLTPETHVYLAVDNQIGNNLATNSFSAENTESAEGMISTSIMAAIPIDSYHAQYTSQTDRLFFVDIASRVASSLKLVLLDSCGRRFPYARSRYNNNDAEEADPGRSFRCTMRVDIIKSNKTGTLRTRPTPKSVPPRFASTPAKVLNLGIPGYGLNTPGEVYGDGYDALAG